MLVNIVSWGKGCGATMYSLNSILFACGGKENVEMHGSHFYLACCGDWKGVEAGVAPPLHPTQVYHSASLALAVCLCCCSAICLRSDMANMPGKIQNKIRL